MIRFSAEYFADLCMKSALYDLLDQIGLEYNYATRRSRGNSLKIANRRCHYNKYTKIQKYIFNDNYKFMEQAKTGYEPYYLFLSHQLVALALWHTPHTRAAPSAQLK